MPSPGPKINSSLDQLMDISNRLGLFTPNNNSSAIQDINPASQFPTVNRKPTIQGPSLSVQQQQSLYMYNMEKKQQRQQNFNTAIGMGMGALSFIDHLIPEQKIKNPVVRPLPTYNPEPYGTGSEAIAKDGIHIAPSKRGTFTAAAKKHGKGVQEFARQVLAHKDNYSPAMVKKANFAHNAAGWHHKAEMGMMLPGVNGVAGGKKAEDGMSITGGPGDPEKSYSFVDELKSLSSKKLDGSSPFALAKKASAYTKIDPSLLFSSAYVEGMNKNLTDPRPLQSDAYVNALHGYYTDFSGKNKLGKQSTFDASQYPVDGYATYGLDTFGQRFDEFVKKGYLPATFKDQFVPYTASNEKEKVTTAAFKSNEAALEAKAAYLRATQDDVQSYFKKKNQQLDPDAQNFFTMALYNATPKSAYKMMDEYMTAKDKKGFLEQGQTKYKSIWNHIHQRMELMPVVNDYLSQNMKNGGNLPMYYEGGKSYDLSPEQIKTLLAQGYELDFE